MRRSHTEAETAPLGVNLTPMIDLVFILLIFFIVTSSFVKETGIDVSRPSAETATRKEASNILVALNKDGAIWIERRNVDLRTLRVHIERLHAENPAAQVIVIPDKAVVAERLVRVLDQVRLAGVERIALAATPNNDP